MQNKASTQRQFFVDESGPYFYLTGGFVVVYSGNTSAQGYPVPDAAQGWGHPLRSGRERIFSCQFPFLPILCE